MFCKKKFDYLIIPIDAYIGYSPNCFVGFSAYIGYFPNCFAYFTASIGKYWKRYIPSKTSRFGIKFRESQSIKSIIQIMIKIILNIRRQFASFCDSAVTYYTRRLEYTLIHQHRTSYVTLRQILLVLYDKRDLMFLEIQKHLH